MKPDLKMNTLPAGADCLGCKDCKGLCRALLDMAVLPETVLHTR
jgi:hypothetical protein